MQVQSYIRTLYRMIRIHDCELRECHIEEAYRRPPYPTRYRQATSSLTDRSRTV